MLDKLPPRIGYYVDESDPLSLLHDKKSAGEMFNSEGITAEKAIPNANGKTWEEKVRWMLDYYNVSHSGPQKKGVDFPILNNGLRIGLECKGQKDALSASGQAQSYPHVLYKYVKNPRMLKEWDQIVFMFKYMGNRKPAPAFSGIITHMKEVAKDTIGEENLIILYGLRQLEDYIRGSLVYNEPHNFWK